MNLHKNARLTPHGRLVLVKRVVHHGLRVHEAAQAAGVSVRTAFKWLARYRHGGEAALVDGHSRPQNCPHATPAEVCSNIIALRYERRTQRQIAVELRVSTSTVSRVLKRAGLSRLSDLEPAPPVIRYEREQPGELIHLDIKKLGRFRHPGHRFTPPAGKHKSRGAGWEYVHVAIDDHSRMAHTTIRPDETSDSACQALTAALCYFRALGVSVQGILTDNGSCYRSKAFKRLCRRMGLKHIFTRPYRPQTNGKAERFIQTCLREWAYAREYRCSGERAQALLPFVHRYNWHRPHASLNYEPPISRLSLNMNNLLALHT